MQSAQESLGFLFQDVARLMRRNFNRRVQDLNLTQAQWQILVRVSRMPGARQSQIADILEMQPISVARIIDRMELSGWIERRPDPEDRRAVNLYLTPGAEPILEQMRARAALTKEISLAGITREEQKILTGILEKMKINLAGETEEK